MSRIRALSPAAGLALSLGFTLLTLGPSGCGPPEGDDETFNMTGVETIRRALVSTTSAEYKLPASDDPDVLPGTVTELWARVYRPAVLVSGKTYPLIVFLHGNNGTCGHGSNPRIDDNCGYTNTGICSEPGYVVTPNHLGYEYIANELAGNEYIVVSINANRGIGCLDSPTDDYGLIQARGRLVLKHLSMLSFWNRTPEATPGSLDFSFFEQLDLQNVGLVGHSRGGEAVRAAYNLYSDAGSPWPAKISEPVRFRGLFEIAPTDGQAGRVLNALDMRWAVLLPMCDGDVTYMDGMNPFDRMVAHQGVETDETMKATFLVYGANHNFYNSEWQQSEPGAGCLGHSPCTTPATRARSASARPRASRS